MNAMKSYDVFGNIAVLKFRKEVKIKDRKKFALRFLDKHKNISTVVEKIEGFKGRLRKQSTRWLAGERTKEALYKENGCEFRFNVDSCYFSPRLSSDRKNIVEMIKKGEEVLVMFGGVAPYAIVISKLSKAKKVVSVELSRECSIYARTNVKRNKLDNVEIVQADVRKLHILDNSLQVKRGNKFEKILTLDEKGFDRIVMARPNLKDDFLDVAFSISKKGTRIHYHGFYDEKDIDVLKELILKRAEESGKKIKINKISKIGNIGPYRYRFRVDLIVS